MGRDVKPIELAKGHRTKAEKDIRAKAEKELITGVQMMEFDEVRNNPRAHAEFIRISNLLGIINKNDDLCSHIINMHCMLVAECDELAKIKQMFVDNLSEFNDKSVDENMSFTEKIKIKMGLQKNIIDCDKQLAIKRKMLIDIAKENVMSISSQLRSIPKKPPEKQPSKMLRFLQERKDNSESP